MLIRIFVMRIRAEISARMSRLNSRVKTLLTPLDPVRRALGKGSRVLLRIIAGLLMNHRSGRFSASRLLVRQGLPIPGISRRTRVAQDAVRMFMPGNHALPRRRQRGNIFRSAETATGRAG
jgi:hypothetical protein